MNNKILTWLCCGLALTAAPITWAQKSLPDDVYVSVNGEEINEKLVTQIIGDAQVPPEQFAEVLKQIINNTVIAQEATKLGYAEQPDVQLELRLSKMLVLGRSYVRNFLAENPITAGQIEAAFAAASSDGPQQEYRARHILVKSATEAKQLMDEIDGDLKKFIELAQKSSIDTGSGEQGGELGWALPSTFVPEFGNAMASLEPGAFSDPVQSQFGWHLIYLDDVRVLPQPELNDQTRNQILETLRQEIVLEEFARLAEAAEIIRNEGKAPPAK